MNKTKYVIYPGYITSSNDGDRHFISYTRLVRLYGLRLGECVDVAYTRGYSQPHLQEMIHLHPLPTGEDYQEYLRTLQEEKVKEQA
jgi:hypothetical protein